MSGHLHIYVTYVQVFNCVQKDNRNAYKYDTIVLPFLSPSDLRDQGQLDSACNRCSRDNPSIHLLANRTRSDIRQRL